MMTAPFLDGTVCVWLDSRVPFSAESLSKLWKSTRTATRNAEMIQEWENCSRLPESLFCKEISQSPLGACIAIVVVLLLHVRFSFFNYFPVPIALQTPEPCVYSDVCVYTLSTKAVLSPGSLCIGAFSVPLSVWVHTSCRQVQSLCSPSTDTQSCLIKLLDQ